MTQKASFFGLAKTENQWVLLLDLFNFNDELFLERLTGKGKELRIWEVRKIILALNCNLQYEYDSSVTVMQVTLF